MAREFDPRQLVDLGWRQGAILGERLAALAWRHAPSRLKGDQQDHLVVTSHDCDILNVSLGKEPLVEVLRARVPDAPAGQRAYHSAGRNPRALRLSEVTVRGDVIALDLAVHDRWEIPRELLLEEAPADRLPGKECRLVAEWLAKRYIRAAFPTVFDARWRGEFKAWWQLLEKYNSLIQGVYLRLNTLGELTVSVPYKCDLLLAVPSSKRHLPEWSAIAEATKRDFSEFWNRLLPGIECVGIEVRTTDRITLDDLERYQRFDADWMSFEDETPTTATESDLRA